MANRPCKYCRKRDDKPKQTVGLSVVHEGCLKRFIDQTLKDNRTKKKLVKQKKALKIKKLRKKLKETPTYWRKKAITLAKKKAILRDGTQCMHCGKEAPTIQIQASHVHSVGTKLFLAADPMNIKPLCGQCHEFWWHSNPLEAAEWFKKKFPDRYSYLQKEIFNHPPGRVDWESKFKQLKESK